MTLETFEHFVSYYFPGTAHLYARTGNKATLTKMVHRVKRSFIYYFFYDAPFGEAE
jgi:hypothetical protein